MPSPPLSSAHPSDPIISHTKPTKRNETRQNQAHLESFREQLVEERVQELRRCEESLKAAAAAGAGGAAAVADGAWGCGVVSTVMWGVDV